MPEQVTILGDGAMATVCAILLTHGGHGVTIWGALEESIQRLMQNREQTRLLPGVRIPRQVRLTADEQGCFAGCTMVLSAIPTQYMRGVWQRVKPFAPPAVPILSVTKGIENETLLRPTEIIEQVVGESAGDRLAVLSGPNIAGEIARFKPATAVVAARRAEQAQKIQQIVSTKWFRVYTNDDAIGVELAGAVKNVIAIAAGMLDGMGAGSNAKAALVTRGLVEITRLGMALGAKESTFNGLAGLGDLITTCISPEGRNRMVGERLGKGMKLSEALGSTASVVEGVATTKSVVQLAAKHHIEMPITEAVHRVLFENEDPLDMLSDLMSRDPKPEKMDN
jgi:glycerol-3-phosphate dehydrogenase (NAD(P)+)